MDRYPNRARFLEFGTIQNVLILRAVGLLEEMVHNYLKRKRISARSARKR